MHNIPSHPLNPLNCSNFLFMSLSFAPVFFEDQFHRHHFDTLPKDAVFPLEQGFFLPPKL